MSEGPIQRVLMTADTVGGVWTFALELARGLAAHGVEVILAAMGGFPSDEQRREAASLANLRLLASSYRLEWMERPWADVDDSSGWLLDLTRRYEPDVIHLNGYCHGALPFGAPVIMTAHSCVLSWWNAVRNEEAPPEWDLYQRRVRQGLLAADLLTAPSNAMLETIKRHYGPGLPAARMIPNGRDGGLFRPDAKKPMIFAAGRLWDEAKNVQALTRIAASLPWPVWLAGEDRHPMNAPADAAEPAANGTLRLGHLPARRLADCCACAAIFAHPARYEPFGLTVLEAAMSGCALVLGDIPSLRENWNGAALFVPPDEPERLKETLLELTGNPALREQMGRRSLARASFFSAEQMAADYMAAYGAVTAGRRVACVS
ncbi:MAG TPA: glycosyltransferase family 4 protein [Bryobacteraceae bacterium]|jgi:glycosyltransferase involved in cell wall biosynthesis